MLTTWSPVRGTVPRSGSKLANPAPYATAPGPPAPYRDEAHEPPNADQETAEYSLEEASPEQEGEPDDVLEETPEFLQDTPDHDRLWFEQRPPRDFDFDG